jgi:hypothetical protein
MVVDRVAVEFIIDMFCSYVPDDGEQHVSDMTILHKKHKGLVDTVDFMRCFSQEDWTNRPLVHYGNAYLPKDVVRSDFIRGLLSWSD